MKPNCRRALQSALEHIDGIGGSTGEKHDHAKLHLMEKKCASRYHRKSVGKNRGTRQTAIDGPQSRASRPRGRFCASSRFLSGPHFDAFTWQHLAALEGFETHVQLSSQPCRNFLCCNHRRFNSKDTVTSDVFTGHRAAFARKGGPA